VILALGEKYCEHIKHHEHPSIAGHSFGDGYIHTNRFYFVYTNASEELLKSVWRM